MRDETSRTVLTVRALIAPGERLEILPLFERLSAQLDATAELAFDRLPELAELPQVHRRAAIVAANELNRYANWAAQSAREIVQSIERARAGTAAQEGERHGLD